MKELILICAVAVVFALCFLLLKKLDIFFGDSSRTVISSDTVSYTHLDVYKRQGFIQAKDVFGKESDREKQESIHE